MTPSSETYRLVYYSRNLIARSEVASQLEQILETSQRNNAAVGLTGALIFNSGIFAQVIEGERKNIEMTFERIQQDPRHSDVLVLAYERVQSRHFPNWSMGYVGRLVPDAQLVGEPIDGNTFDVGLLSGDRVLEIMIRIAAEEEEASA